MHLEERKDEWDQVAIRGGSLGTNLRQPIRHLQHVDRSLEKLEALSDYASCNAVKALDRNWAKVCELEASKPASACRSLTSPRNLSSLNLHIFFVIWSKSNINKF